MGPILFVLFIVVPLLELAVIIQVGEVLGAGATILLLLAVSIVGAMLVKREGLKAWYRFRQALAEGRVPAKEVVDGALLLFGGALLLTPGFITDTVGLLLFLGPARAAVRRVLRGRIRVFGAPLPGAPSGRAGSSGPSGSHQDSGRHGSDDEVIDIEVVDVRRNEPRGDRDDG